VSGDANQSNLTWHRKILRGGSPLQLPQRHFNDSYTLQNVGQIIISQSTYRRRRRDSVTFKISFFLLFLPSWTSLAPLLHYLIVTTSVSNMPHEKEAASSSQPCRRRENRGESEPQLVDSESLAPACEAASDDHARHALQRPNAWLPGSTTESRRSVPSSLEQLLQSRDFVGPLQFDSLSPPAGESTFNPGGGGTTVTSTTVQILEEACQIAQDVDEILAQVDSQGQARGGRGPLSPPSDGGQ
jgi:hypothetical protein